MKICVVGTGGVGGFFGSLLAKAGHDVTFVARGAHLQAIKADGLQVESDSMGTFTVNSFATDRFSDIDPVDLILFTVKMYDNITTAPLLIPLLKPSTLVLTLQNGVSSGDTLCEVLGEEHVLLGSAYIEGRIKEPGIIRQIGKFCRVVFGERHPGITPRVTNLYETFKEAEWTVEVAENMTARSWEKFIYIAATAGVCAATGANYGEMYQTLETRKTLLAAMHEAANVAKAAQIPIGEDSIEKSIHAMQTFNPTSRSSMAKDFTDGKPVELDGLTGEVIRRGKLLGIPTPVNDIIYSILKPLALRAEQSK
jgi:2-dehydropantoate 2-reductase|tara:strand:- start:3763 stop:4692 length:930 start_codon:yes stop_codon:yes gene_type:complete